MAKYRLGYTAIANLHDDGSEEYRDLKKETYNFRALEKKIIFPLTNTVGKTNGVEVRRIDASKDKYGKYMDILMPEAKNIGAFFGLYEAMPSILDTGLVYVTEGCLDCISLARVYPNTVSCLTASLNDDQYWILDTLADDIILVFDSDNAGRAGAYKAKEKYGDKIKDRQIGYNDVNSCLTTMGSKFPRYIKSKLEVLSF